MTMGAHQQIVAINTANANGHQEAQNEGSTSD